MDPTITKYFQKLCLLEPFLLAVIRKDKPPEVRLPYYNSLVSDL